jgi:hypothetical protein
MDFEDQLSTAMRSSVETLTPPVSDLVAGGLDRGRRLRRRRVAVRGAAVAAAVVALAGSGLVVLDNRNDTSTTIASAGGSCRSEVRTDVLPTWARDGFSDPNPAVPHVFSSHGRMVAILFGATLSSPPAAGVNNKILWVARDGRDASAPLRLDAVRAGTTAHVRREVAVGPSTVDLPRPGCWRITLRWGSQHDTIDLDYVRG